MDREALVSDAREIKAGDDLEKFFDRVSHDFLIGRLQKQISDVGIIRLIRAYLNSGILQDGMVHTRYQGTPQGGPCRQLAGECIAW